MGGAEEVIMMPLGGKADPLLEKILAAEGYRVRVSRSLSDALEQSAPDSCSAVVIQMGEETRSVVDEILLEASAKLPGAKFLITCPNGQTRLTAEMEKQYTGRLLWVSGEVGYSQNVDQIRRFLRGEGYRFASDLAALSQEEVSLFEPELVADGLASGQPTRMQQQVLRFAAELSRFADLRPMLQEALRRFTDILECGAGSIYLWDENSETLVLEVARGPEESQRVGLRQKLGEGLAGWVAEVGEPVLVTDSRKVKRLRGRVCHRYTNFSCLAVPVTHGGQLFGVVCVTMPKDDAPLDPADLRVAQALSRKLASAIRPLSVISELRRFSERLLGTFKSATDLELKREAQVESLRTFSGNILDSIPLAVVAYDRQLHIRSSNQMARTQLGTDVSSAALAPLEGRVDLDPQMWRNRLLSVIESGRRFRLQKVGYRADDQMMVLDIHCAPLCDPNGQVVGGILTAQDMTDDAELEAKLHAAERLAIIGKVAAKVAHELNNPLDGILRFLNLAVRQIHEPEKAKSYLADCRVGLLRMSNILTELLAFSRSNRKPEAPVSLTSIIHQALAPYEQRARDSGMRLQLEIPPDLPPCPFSEVWEVFSNVAKNALDAMKDQGVLTVRARVDGPNVIVTVSDTGPGVPAELHERIFEPFFTTKSVNMGTGLGLALCRDALRRIGGDICLAPSDVGAAFEITLPTKENPE